VDGPGRADDWLIDCGNSNAVTFVTEPLLHAQGVNRLPRLALTHGDLQHIGGADIIRADFLTPTVYTSPVRFRSAAYRAILDELTEVPAQHVTLNPGDHAGCWTVLHPAADDKFAQADDAGLVLRGEFFGTRVLLLADLGRPGQETLLRRAADPRADIVVTGLPEQGEALCDGLIAAIQPRLIIVADSQFPATKRASPALLQRLAASGIPVLSTRETGAVVLHLRPGGWQVDPTLKPPAERVISDTFADAPHTAAAGIP
jgi:competence protein ComEC